MSAPVPEPGPVQSYLMELQDRICGALEAEGGAIEKAAVHFTRSAGRELPPAATARRPELAGRAFEALSLSLIVHPRNPYAPTSHMNLRFFIAGPDLPDPAWWFGGGFDLTPAYGFAEDAVDWHRGARAACEPFGVGGLFFDDWDEGGFARSFGLVRSLGDHYLGAYVPILQRRKQTPFGERERAFQLYRRGRYVEFNLLYDRGTRYGLQSGRRVESVLASLPPLVAWHYDWQPEPDSPEARLRDDFLVPRDWV
jgi:coproporphyrinogen III oxidase